MFKFRSAAILVVFAVVFFYMLVIQSNATPSHQFTPFNQIDIAMYVLKSNGHIDFDVLGGDPSCYSVPSNRTKYGCTYFDGGVIGVAPIITYPFTSDTIQLGIETNPVNGVEQGYLHNVVSQEMAEGSVLSSYIAQAIASRTFIYNKSAGGTITINNSGGGGSGESAYQVYIPYRYDGLGEGLGETIKLSRQTTVSQAVTLSDAQYMTTEANNEPIAAYFGQDNEEWTSAGAEPYLKAVYDPISAAEGTVSGTSLGGMSSNGAGRWGYGNTSQYGQGTEWSVRWDEAFQILTHYYTDIYIRDINGQRLVPIYRWNPLRVDWGNGRISPPPMSPAFSYDVVVQLQNSGNLPWTTDTFLSCQWRKPDGSIVDCQNDVYPDTLNVGASNTVVLSVTPNNDFADGDYTLIIDVEKGADFFRNRESGKEWYGLTYPVTIKRNAVYLPLVMKNWDGCVERSEYWYPTGVNTCSPATANCAEGDGEPDGNAAGAFPINNNYHESYHQVTFSPQIIQADTHIAVKWKSATNTGYGDLYFQAEIDGQWVTLGTSGRQSTDHWIWWEPSNPGIGSYAGKHISGVKFGMTRYFMVNHSFWVDGYYIRNFMYCGG